MIQSDAKLPIRLIVALHSADDKIRSTLMGVNDKYPVDTLGLSPCTKISFVDDLVRGINSLANRFRMDIVGGDTVSSPKAVVISVAVIGTVSKKNLMLRSGAMARDKILVTGRLGGSRFGKQFNFIPRIKAAQWLASHARVNAMMDITDGLSMDLYKLITASKVGALIYKEKIPISNDAYRTPYPLKSALSDGEDFELIITTANAERLLTLVMKSIFMVMV